ncbi:MAG: M15 family metallopeptidase [Bacteroidota bacterium]
MKYATFHRIIYLFFISCALLACQPKATEKSSEQAVQAEDSTLVIAQQQVATDSIVAEVPRIEYDYDTTKWTDVAISDASIVMDLRYATTNNFVESKMYDCGRCFLRPAVAKAIVAAHQKLQQDSLGLKMFDCYRPRPIQWKLWEKVPDPRYVADPRKGSMHNRGGAVDLTIVDAQGQELDMGTDFDFFGPKAYQAFTDLPQTVLDNRQLLRSTMLEFGFQPIKTEWWHYSYAAKTYALSDMLWNCETVE